MTTTEPLVQLNGHRSDRWVGHMLKLFIVAVIFTVGAAAQHWVFESGAEWDPLGPYPTQTVMNPTDVPLDGFLLVEGKKCAKETVSVTSVQLWANTSQAIKTGEGGGTQEKGCTVFSDDPAKNPDLPAFRNPVPAAVAEAQRRLCAAGAPNVPWKLIGKVTPRGDGRVGHLTVWTTQPFTLGC